MRDQAILLFAPGPWDEIWRNRHQIFTRLARDNPVIWVEPREAWRPALRRLRAGEWRSPHFWRPRVRQPWPNLWVVSTPPGAPLTRREPLGRLTQALREAPIRALLRRLGVERPLLWLFHPTLWDQRGRWGERLVIYHLVDEYTAYSSDPRVRAELVADERRMFGAADLVFVTSQKLLEAKRTQHPRVHWVGNGVDARAFAEATPAPEFAALPHPRLGYVGAINRKIDLGLLDRVAEAHSDATLLLVGPVDPRIDAEAWQRLIARPNVHYAGSRGVSEVPGAMRACDVGLLPYVRSLWTEHINSLKLNEYLAAGLPVVAVALPMVAEVRHLVEVAEDAESFVAGVAAARRPQPPEAVAARQAHAAAHDWEQRVATLAGIVSARLDDVS